MNTTVGRLTARAAASRGKGEVIDATNSKQSLCFLCGYSSTCSLHGLFGSSYPRAGTNVRAYSDYSTQHSGAKRNGDVRDACADDCSVAGCADSAADYRDDAADRAGDGLWCAYIGAPADREEHAGGAPTRA